jgi:hypothetical protein
MLTRMRLTGLPSSELALDPALNHSIHKPLDSTIQLGRVIS